MVAVAILGLSLTVILSAQAGLYAGGNYAQHTSIATGDPTPGPIQRNADCSGTALPLSSMPATVSQSGLACHSKPPHPRMRDARPSARTTKRVAPDA